MVNMLIIRITYRTPQNRVSNTIMHVILNAMNIVVYYTTSEIMLGCPFCNCSIQIWLPLSQGSNWSWV